MMNAIDYIYEFMMTKAFEDYVETAYFSNSFSTEEAYVMMLITAREQGIILKNLGDVNYDRIFHRGYKFSAQELK